MGRWHLSNRCASVKIWDRERWAVLKIDEQIKVCDRAICRHISQFDVSGRGAISQDILSNLRNFVEHIMLKIYADGKDVEDDWKTIQRAVHYVKSRGEWKAL